METATEENVVYLIAIGTFSLVTLLVGVFTFVLLYHKKQLQHIKEKQITEANHQRDLLTNFIDTQEAERSRIAADLHDEVGGSIAALKLNLNQLRIAKDDLQKFKESIAILENTSKTVRRISHDLMPPRLEKLGLRKSLDGIAKNYSNQEFEVVVEGDASIQVDEGKSLAIYRIVLELLNNTIKHAKATKAAISIHQNQAILLTYKDNGEGYSNQEHEGLGLRNIKTRVQSQAGSIEFFSEPFVETGVNILFPL